MTCENRFLRHPSHPFTNLEESSGLSRMILNGSFVGLHSKFERRIFLGKRKTAFYRNISGTEEVVYKNGIDTQ
jgi:hypothetical protein